jgi:hypothetical protein
VDIVSEVLAEGREVNALKARVVILLQEPQGRISSPLSFNHNGQSACNISRALSSPLTRYALLDNQQLLLNHIQELGEKFDAVLMSMKLADEL